MVQKVHHSFLLASYMYILTTYAEIMLQVLLYSCSLAKFKGVVSRNSPNKPWILWQFNLNAHLSQILSETAATLCGWCVDWPSSFRMIVLMDNHWYTKLLSCLSPYILKDFLDQWYLWDSHDWWAFSTLEGSWGTLSCVLWYFLCWCILELYGTIVVWLFCWLKYH